MSNQTKTLNTTHNVEMQFKGSSTWHFFDFGDTKAEAEGIAKRVMERRPHLQVRVVEEGAP